MNLYKIKKLKKHQCSTHFFPLIWARDKCSSPSRVSVKKVRSYTAMSNIVGISKYCDGICNIVGGRGWSDAGVVGWSEGVVVVLSVAVEEVGVSTILFATPTIAVVLVLVCVCSTV